MMKLLTGVSEAPADDTAKETHSAEALCSAGTSVTHGIWREEDDAQQDAVNHMIQITKSSKIGRWSALKLANGKHRFRYGRRIHTALITSRLRLSKSN
jgi:hypothetical protein